MDEVRFAGLDGRECGEHRTTGRRAWCHDCTEWCYPDAPCKGCELPQLRARVAELEAAAEFDGIPYLRLALTRTRPEQQTVTFRRETLVQAVRRVAELETEIAVLHAREAIRAGGATPITDADLDADPED